jgi:hypothetical protein
MKIRAGKWGLNLKMGLEGTDVTNILKPQIEDG